MIYMELRLSICLLKSEHAVMFVCFEIALNLPRGLFGPIEKYFHQICFSSLYRSRNLSLRYRYVARGKGFSLQHPLEFGGFRKEDRKRNSHSLIVTLMKSPWWKRLSYLCLSNKFFCQMALCSGLLWREIKQLTLQWQWWRWSNNSMFNSDRGVE